MAILEKETYKKFGYYSTQWTQKSDKKVIAKCDKCGSIRIAQKRCSNHLCPTCSAQHIKYPLLFDFNWIFQKYKVERKSIIEIAKLLGCKRTAVSNSLKRFDICKNFKYPDLENKKWLQQKYWVEKKTTMEIAKLLGCSDSAVRRALKRLGIPKRSDIPFGRKTSEKTKQKMREAMKHRNFPNHHTKPELIFEQICKRNNLPFHYVGDRQLWIGKDKILNPDFIEANGKKICVEIMGAYWHSPLINKHLQESATQSYRERHYKKYKWIPVFIWDTDLLRVDAEDFILSELKKGGVI